MYVYDGKRLVQVEMYDYIRTPSGWSYVQTEDGTSVFEYSDIVPLGELPPFDAEKQAYIVPDVQAVIDAAIECEEGIPDCCAVVTEFDPITGAMLPC